MAQSALEKEIRKLWKALKNSPERGDVGTIEEFSKEVSSKMSDFPADPDGEEYGWAYKISEIKKSYGIGPSSNYDLFKAPLQESGPKKSWWEKEQTHLSKDNRYYVVPLVFENMIKNINLVDYKIDGKYKIGEIGQSGTLLGNEEFINKCKKWALKKLKRNLDKAIATPDLEKLSKDFAIIPKNRKTNGNSAAQAWTIVPRRPDYQTLWIKVIFDRQWVDSLPPKIDPDIDYGSVSNEVMIFTKDLKKYLTNLETILKHFDAQIQLAYAQSGVETSFNARCLFGNVAQVYETIDGLLAANKKGRLKDLEKDNGALQFGFTKDFALRYIAYSDMPDCLCDQNENINAYNLRNSLDIVKSNSPLSNATINNFMYLLPAINRRYSRYLKTTNKVSGDLFSTKQSWLNFINTYVYPRPDVAYSGTNSTDTAKEWLATIGITKSLSNPFYKNLLVSGQYIQDPIGNVMSEDTKNMVAAASNVTYMDTSDDNMMKALVSEVKSITSLYDNLINKIPISELVKLAGGLIFKCLGDSEMKKHLCEAILTTIPISEIRQQLYPCLRDLGPEGELAIAKLEEKITGQVGNVYKIAQDRFPDKFADTKDPAEQAQALSQVTSLYCSDPYMQKKLGRSPDDFSDELAKWAQDAANDAICDCVFTLYGPIEQFVDALQDITEEVVDGALSPAKDKAHSLNKESTLALDRMLNPIKSFLKSENKMADVGKAFGQGLTDMAMNLIYASVLILVKYAKDEILGSYTKDMCNKSQDDIFQKASLKDWLLKSKLYEDSGEEQIWDKFSDLKAKHFFSQDIQDLITSYEKIGQICTPNELKRVFTTECSDTSFDATYEIIANGFMSDESKQQLYEDFPGESLSSIIALTGYSPTNEPGSNSKSVKIESPETGLMEEYTLPEDFISPGQIHEFLYDVGNTIDPNIFDDFIDEYEALKKLFSSLCDPVNLGELAGTIDKEDILNLAAGDKEDVLDDITKILPLLDEEKMKNMLPPLFCGPCDPNQTGMKPIMGSQTHPTQLFMQKKLNDHTYKTIDGVFNNNLSVFKLILKEAGSTSLINKLIDKLPSSNEETPPDSAQSSYSDAIKSILQDVQDNNLDEMENKFVAKKFRKKINEFLSSDVKNLIEFNPEEKISIFKYEIPDDESEKSAYVLYMVINFNTEGKTCTVAGIDISPPQIKLICVNSGIVEFQYPVDGSKVKDFNFEDVSTNILRYFYAPDGQDLKGNKHSSDILTALLGFGMLKDGTTRDLFESIFPLASSAILETIWKNSTTDNKLFENKTFNLLPLTNSEALEKCADTDIVPIMNVEKIKQDIEDERQSLECVISMFATPDSMQVANLFGLYKALIKVCVVEEFLKNIFMFSFAKISDIIDDPAYMGLVKMSVRNSIESILSSGYDDLLEYSEKIVNGRLKAMDPSELEGLSEQELKEKTVMKKPEDCLNVLILEAALEVDSIFDSRVRLHIYKSWKDKFTTIGELEGDIGTTKNQFLQYGVNKKIMEDTRYPSRKYIDMGLGLQAKRLPSFEVIDHKKTELEKLNPLPDGNGGLYWEPYIRMNSKLAVDDPQNGPEAFWAKFKKAFEYWDKAVFRHDDDNGAGEKFVKNSSKVKDMFFTAENTNDKQYTQPGFESPAFTGGSFFKTIFNTTAEGFSGARPKGSTPFQDLNLDRAFEVVRIRKFLKALIDKIDWEYEQNGSLIHDGSFFEKFFILFFSPLDKSGTPYKHLEGENSLRHGIDPHAGAGNDYRSVFENVVGSFLHAGPKSGIDLQKEHDPFGDEQIYGSTKSDIFATIAGAELDGNRPYLDAFYYWQKYPDGVIPAARSSFKNRGIINFNQIKFHKPEEEVKNNFIGRAGSHIGVFAGAKQTNIWGAGSGMFPTEVDHNDAYAETIVEFMAEVDASPKESGMANGTWLPYPADTSNDTQRRANRSAAYTLYNYLKAVIVDSPYDLWFDFSLGMRLNLVIPYAGDDISDASEEYINGIIKKFVDVSGMNVEIDRNYNLDKVFLLAAPGENDSQLNKGLSKKWICIPMEFVEYDLYDYWKEVHGHIKGKFPHTYNPDKPQAPLVPEYQAFSQDWFPQDQTAVKKSPWHLIMKDIIHLGSPADFGPGQKFGVWHSTAPSDYYSDQMIYSSQENLHANILYNNMHVPMKFTNNWGTYQKQLNHKPYDKNASDKDFVRPTLWAASKLINTALSPEVMEGADVVENKHKEEIIERLKFELLQKIDNSDNDILNEILPVRESVFTSALVYRYTMQASYPALDNLFEPTKLMINSFITQHLKTIDGDYSYVNSVVDEANEEDRLNTSSPSPGDIATMFFEMVVQMAANTVDPTWKTPWFFPGPLTPIGIVAKILSSSEDKEDKEDLKKNKIGEKEPCEDGKETQAEDT
jgi:hypothetical protein